MVVFDDLVAEQDALDAILSGLDDSDWAAPSAAAGWTVADVVLHLAQTEEAVTASAAGAGLVARSPDGATLDEVMDRLVRAERQAPAAVLLRWRTARLAAVAALRAADPDQPLSWAAAPLKPATLATTRLAEHWAHGLDISGPLGIRFPDTARLRHIAWLAYRTLPYAFALAGEQPQTVFCTLTAPDGTDTWRYGPPDADSTITGPAGAFCRVAAQRLTPDQSGLLTSGPHGATALGVLRTYAALPSHVTFSGRGADCPGAIAMCGTCCMVDSPTTTQNWAFCAPRSHARRARQRDIVLQAQAGGGDLPDRLDAGHAAGLSLSGRCACHLAEEANRGPGLDRLPLFQAVKNSSSSGTSAAGDTLCVWPSRTR